MLFLALKNADFQFGAEKFTWRSYTTIEALLTTNWVKFSNKREFAITGLDGNSETFVVQVVTLKVLTVMPSTLLAPPRSKTI